MANYSYSKLATFKRCRYQYKLTYIDRLQSPLENIESFLGSRFHELMEEVYSDGKDKTFFVEELIHRFHVLWKEKWHDHIQIKDSEKSEEDYLKYGEECIRNFYDSFLGFGKAESSQTIATEMKIEFSLDTKGKDKVVGYMDRLTQDQDGVYEIQDYKTSVSLPPEDELEANEQLVFYQIGLLNAWKQEGREPSPIRLVFHYVGHAKTFTFQGKTEEQLRELVHHIRNQVQLIKIERTFRASVSQYCKWCAFQQVCPEYQMSLKETVQTVSET